MKDNRLGIRRCMSVSRILMAAAGLLLLCALFQESGRRFFLFSTVIVLAVLCCVNEKNLLYTKRHFEQFDSLLEEFSEDSQRLSGDEKRRIAAEDVDGLREAIEKKYATQILHTQTEIDALQSQINPHFLYNTLEVIRGLAIINEENDIANMTEALASMFRYSISNDSENVTFNQELQNVERYILIQQYRFPDKFVLQYEFDEKDANLANYRMPRLTIQPIVENAIRHGLETKNGDGVIIIKAFTTQSRLLIRIADNGEGISPKRLDQLNSTLESSQQRQTERSSESTGIALANVNRRIKLCYGEQYGLFVSSILNRGTTVDITLPLYLGAGEQ